MNIKQELGLFASHLITDGMVVGLGTGSTVEWFIKALGDRCRNGLNINAVATSIMSEKLARSIPIIDINDVDGIDVTIDGADEIDGQKRLIKGGGGALLREKIIANISTEMVVIADEGKLVTQLGKFGLPVEVVPFGIYATLKHISENGFRGKIRYNSDGTLFFTDNGNNIVDIEYPNLCEDPETDHKKLIGITGVIETGFFFNLAKRIIIGYKNGEIKIKS